MQIKAKDTQEGEQRALSPEDRVIFEVIEKAQEQYRGYLAASEVGSLAKLTAPRPGDQPPRIDLPLTLTVS